MATRGLGASGSGGAFQGFTAGDFNAYEPKKWGSNAYTLERRRAKDALLALARSLQSELEEELQGLELGASDESPTVANARKVEAQWVFLTRGTADRSTLRTLLQRTDLHEGAGLFDIAIQHQHACLMMRLDYQGFAVSVEVATKAKVDRDNAVEKLKQGWAKDKLIELAKALPGQTTIGVGKKRSDAIALKPSDIEAWIEPLAQIEQPFVAEATLAKSEEILASKAFIGTAVEHVSSFIPLYRFLAWSRENDYTQVKTAVQKEAADRQKRPAQFEPGARVTILSGLFAGRSGYLAELDAKGRAKVMVGPVSVTVDAKDLKAS